MFEKIYALEKLQGLGLNVHNYKVCSTLDEVCNAVKLYDYTCSIRTDSATGVNKDLPFYLIDSIDDLRNNIANIKRDISRSLKFIVSDGHKFDANMKLNLVCNIESNGQFILEYSTLKVPLRHMYKYPKNLIYIDGNINEQLRYWRAYNLQTNTIDLRVIRDEIFDIYDIAYSKNLWRTYFEITTYEQSCGALNKPYVVWQV